MSQNAKILKHLQAGHRLTPLTALKRFGTLRLGGRIYDLKKQGCPIVSRMVKRGNSRVAEYRLA